MAINKVVLGNQTVMDITDTTADANDVIEGEVFYTQSGTRTVGTLGGATTSAHGLMSANDKTKLDGIDLSLYAPKANPVFTGSVSMGRADGSTVGSGSFVIGSGLTASGLESFAQGKNNTASGPWSCAFGLNSTASTQNAVAMGFSCTSEGIASVAIGESAQATIESAVAIGFGTIATTPYAIGLGKYNYMIQSPKWVKNTSYSVGDRVTRGGMGIYKCITANTDSSWTSSHWESVNRSDNDIILSVGNGTSSTDRSNALTITLDGRVFVKGDLYINANADGSGGSQVATVSQIPSVPVTDVQINSTSILSSGVANIPVANYETHGVVKVAQNTDGLYVNTDGFLSVARATEEMIKAGTNGYRPIAPWQVHTATFYGLAKAAGEDMASSNNNIGTYTSAAQTAIQQMIGAQAAIEVIRL